MPRRRSALESEVRRLQGQYERPYRQWLHKGEIAADHDLYGGQVGLEEGPHRGRGPRGWRRSDEDVRDDVCGALTDDPRIDARTIEVSVQDGIVTLRGGVEDRFLKWLAEDVALSVRGTVDVDNELKIVWPSEREAR